MCILRSLWQGPMASSGQLHGLPSDNPSSNPAEASSFSVKNLFEKSDNKQWRGLPIFQIRLLQILRENGFLFGSVIKARAGKLQSVVDVIKLFLEEIWISPKLRNGKKLFLMSEPALKYENNASFEQIYTQKLLIAFKMACFCCFSFGGI